MSIQITPVNDEVSSLRSEDGETAQAIVTESPHNRQLSAVLWIVLAWVAGTIIFEITAIGSEPKHVVIETDDQPVTLFFHDQNTDVVSPLSGSQNK